MTVDFAESLPNLCSFCGGVKPSKNHARDVGCECTCTSCSDGKEMG